MGYQIICVQFIGGERVKHALIGNCVISYVGFVTEDNAKCTARVCANKAEGDACFDNFLLTCIV